MYIGNMKPSWKPE